MFKTLKKQVKKLNKKPWNKEIPFATDGFKGKPDLVILDQMMKNADLDNQRKTDYEINESLTDITNHVDANSPLFESTYFIDCEASNELSNMVWLLNSSNGALTSTNHGRDIKDKPQWHDISTGYCVPILKDRSMFMQFRLATVNDQIITRYLVSSNKVDFEIVDKWMEKNFFSKGCKKYGASAYLNFE